VHIQTLNWTEWLANVAFGGIGALLGAYFGGYLSEKGKHRATYEDIDNLLATRFREAEQSKAGELKAVEADLHNLLQQTAQITPVQAQIQANINGELWTRQMVWNRRYDLYAEVFQALADFRVLFGSKQYAKEVWKAEYESVVLRLQRLQRISFVFLGHSAREAFTRFYGKVLEFEVEGTGEAIHNFEIALIVAAREDLRVDI
jgi:hypothetical protein